MKVGCNLIAHLNLVSEVSAAQIGGKELMSHLTLGIYSQSYGEQFELKWFATVHKLFP